MVEGGAALPSSSHPKGRSMAKDARRSLFKWQRHMTAFSGALVCWLSVACVAEPLSDDAVGSEPLTPGGELLAKVEIRPGYVVELRELSPGNTIVWGTVNVDEAAGAPPFLADGESLGTVIDVYKHMQAKAGRVVADEDIPEAIRAASLRAEERQRLLVESGVVEQASIPEEPENHTPIRTLAAECSPDVYGDDYGAQWFKDHMCNKLNSNTATTNVASYSAEYRWDGTYWVGFAWLAADFWHGARVKAERYTDIYSGVWPWGGGFTITEVMAEGWVPPRGGHFFYATGMGGRISLTGEGPCPRVHGCKMKTKN
jgi:hypothetical protein